jgi:hypothetical protein
MLFAKIVFGSFLEEDETIIYIFRKPFLFFFVKFVFWGTIAIVSIGGLYFFYPQLILICIAIAVLIFFRVFMIFLFWYTNAIVMTNESIVYIEWPKLFQKKSTRIDFIHLDEITVERVGIKSFLLGYGHVHFSKIGGNAFMIDDISSPNKVARIIEQYREEKVHRKNFAEESTLKNIISSLVNTHIRLNGHPDDDNYKYKHLVEVKKEEKTAIIEQPITEIKKEKFHHKIYKKIFNQKKVHKFEEMNIEIEKEFDDEGGISFKL